MFSIPGLGDGTHTRDEFGACIFDFDGTLADSMWVWEGIDERFCEEHGIDVHGYDENVVGLGFEGTARYFREKLGVKMSVEECCAEFNRLAYDSYAHDVKLVPGAYEFLMSLREIGAPVAIASSLNMKLLEACFANNGLSDYFDTIRLCDDYDTHKSESKIYRVTADALGTPYEHCLVFEDIVPGIKSAKSLSMGTVAVLDENNVGQNTDEITSVADFAIRDFTQLKPVR